MAESMNELNLERIKTNPASAREEDFNLGPPDCKSSALPTRPCLPQDLTDINDITNASYLLFLLLFLHPQLQQ